VAEKKKSNCPNCAYTRTLLTALLDKLGGRRERNAPEHAPKGSCQRCGGKGWYTKHDGNVSECPKCLGGGMSGEVGGKT
jgi:hypothetical protein